MRLKFLLALPDHAAHAIFRFERLCLQKRERLRLCAAHQEDADRGGDQKDQHAQADAAGHVFGDAGCVSAQPGEQDQRDGREHAQKRRQRQPRRGLLPKPEILRRIFQADAAADGLLGLGFGSLLRLKLVF